MTRRGELIKSAVLLVFSLFLFAERGHSSPADLQEPIFVKKVQVPSFDPKEVPVIDYFNGNRVMHAQGPQVVVEVIRDEPNSYIHGKVVGSGANGLTYAPGIAQLLYRKVFAAANKERINLLEIPIAILGAGIHGLWMAHEFIKQGIPASHVCIYAKEFKQTTSYNAAGMWLPIPGSLFVDEQLAQKIEEDSYHAYYALAHQKNLPIKGVREIPLYTWNTHEVPQKLANRGLVPPGNSVVLETQFGQRVEGVMEWRGFFVVDPVELIPSLRKYLKKAGVRFHQKTFYNESEFRNLKAGVVMTFLGEGSSLLSKDQPYLKLSPAEVFYLPHQDGVNHMLFGKTPSGQPFGYIPKGEEQGIVVRYGREEDDPTKFIPGENNTSFLKPGWTYFGKGSSLVASRPPNAKL